MARQPFKPKIQKEQVIMASRNGRECLLARLYAVNGRTRVNKNSSERTQEVYVVIRE